MKSYHLEQFKVIQKTSTYILPTQILQVLANLSKELGVLNIPAIPVTVAAAGHKNRNVRQAMTVTEAMAKPWEKTKPFKATVLDKKEGIEKSINEIRICLNKISNKNYDSQKEQMINAFDGLLQSGIDEESIRFSQEKVATAIIDIASTNQFYSSLYATLYKELDDRFSVFRPILSKYTQQYLDSIALIVCVDPNTEYDKYCVNKKENDKRKAMSVFIVHLMKNGVLESAEVLRILRQLMQTVQEYIDTPNKVNEVEEITENIFLLMTTAKDDFSMDDPEWAELVETAKRCSRMKSKEHLSLSSRVVFKYMDIVDKWKS